MVHKDTCEHQIIKTIQCCGSKKPTQIPWCKKHDRPASESMCRDCKSGRDMTSTQNGWFDKASHIAEGYAHLGMEMLLPKPPNKRENKRAFVQKRLEACNTCQHRTYLAIADYNQWIRDNGGYVKFVKEIDRLERWPDLPDNKDPSNGKLFCKRCKCILSAKANSKKEKCPVKNPAWDIPENER